MGHQFSAVRDPADGYQPSSTEETCLPEYAYHSGASATGGRGPIFEGKHVRRIDFDEICEEPEIFLVVGLMFFFDASALRKVPNAPIHEFVAPLYYGKTNPLPVGIDS